MPFPSPQAAQYYIPQVKQTELGLKIAFEVVCLYLSLKKKKSTVLEAKTNEKKLKFNFKLINFTFASAVEIIFLVMDECWENVLQVVQVRLNW